MAVWALIGVFSGFLVGFTGAGASLLSTPLFMYLLGMSLKETTVSVLYVILAGAFTHLWMQRKLVHWNLGFVLIFTAFIGSWLTNLIKPMTPNLVIQILFICIGIFSVYRTWWPASKKEEKHMPIYFWLMFVLCGLFIGFVITLTGLAGGVILVPFFISFVGLSPRESIATSLFVMFFNGVGSFVVQWERAMEIFVLENIIVLVFGCIVSARVVILLLRGVDPIKLDHFRKVIFSCLIVVSLVLVALK